MSATATRAKPPETLSGAQKCAVLCMALGSQAAAKILQQLSPDEVERVTREIATLSAVGTDAVGAVLREFQSVSKGVDSAAPGGVDVARNMLEQAVGPARAHGVIARIQERAASTGLERLRRASPEALAGILRGEHPQTVALVLAHLDPSQASAAVRALAPDVAAEALYRMARMEKVAPEVLALVESGLGRRTDLSLSQEMTDSGGPAAVAMLLNLSGTALEKQLLEALTLKNEELAGRVKSLMFTFEDLLRVDGKGIQRLLRDIQSRELGLAFKAASEEIRKHIKSNMSERASSALDEEIEMLGPVRVKDVEAAHAHIIEVVRSLGESGEIMIPGSGGGDDVIA